jgi:hypothetical protein
MNSNELRQSLLNKAKNFPGLIARIKATNCAAYTDADQHRILSEIETQLNRMDAVRQNYQSLLRYEPTNNQPSFR